MTACREYQGPRQSKGYGAPTFGVGQVLLHRWVVEQVEGRPLEAGEVVMHTCDNPPCFLYGHLRRASQSDNIQDALAKGRHRYIAHHGEQNGSVKLTADEVLAIRALAAEGALTRAQIGAQFGVCASTVGNIHHRRKWAHL